MFPESTERLRSALRDGIDVVVEFATLGEYRLSGSGPGYDDVVPERAVPVVHGSAARHRPAPHAPAVRRQHARGGPASGCSPAPAQSCVLAER
jgi:hypothetical protein